ncbi:MAG: hypothetical protein NTY51_07720 [Deltaproteobacteria bacterium]|nr:hypothetical protein [Deltaproteobacteria bacterium]
MDQKMFSGIFIKPVATILTFFVAQILFLCAISVDIVSAQQWSINSSALNSSSAGATPTVKTPPYAPSSIAIQQNILAQQRASIQQAITVAKTCIKNASVPQTLRDPQGNVNIVPQTDLVNCTRTLNALLRQLASNQQATINLSQDAQLEAIKLTRKKTTVDLQKRVQRLRGGTN